MKLSTEAVNSVDWQDVYLRLTLYAHGRLFDTSEGLPESLANEAITTLFDPVSTVQWDYESDPSPLRVLGSIINGLVRNRVRKKALTEETLSDDVHSETGYAEGYAPSQQDRLIAVDLRRKILSRVLDLSDGNDLVQEITMLAEDGIIDAADQAERLGVSALHIYEARRHFHKHIETARTELDERP